MAESEVSQPYISKYMQFSEEGSLGGEEVDRFRNREVQYVVDGFPLIENFQRLPVVALSFADVAGNVNI